MYEYNCRLINIINGNTIEAEIDLGFDIWIKQKIRLYNIEDSDKSYNELKRIIPENFVCQTSYSRRGKIGRVLGYVYVYDTHGKRVNINDQLIEQGLNKN